VHSVVVLVGTWFRVLSKSEIAYCSVTAFKKEKKNLQLVSVLSYR